MSGEAPADRAHHHLDPDEELLRDEEGAELRARIHAWADTGTGVHAIPLEDAVALLKDPAHRIRGGETCPPLVWIDVASPGAAEAEFLRDTLRFHPLAVEDCIRGRQRPKIDRYPGYFFIVLYAARINADRKRMALNEVHLFLGKHYVVTVHDHRILEFSEVLARWRAAPKAFTEVGAIAHGIMDAIVDDYFPMIDHYADRVDRLEAEVFQRADDEALQRILSLRRELTIFRKIVAPERDMLTVLLRRDVPFLSPDQLLYFQDVHDHAMRVVEEIDTQRELLGSVLEGHLSMASNQLNVTMRVMGAWSIILMAMAWIAGVYGMNFTHMPELPWRFGYVWALGLMVVLGAVLMVYFRRRRWI